MAPEHRAPPRNVTKSDSEWDEQGGRGFAPCSPQGRPGPPPFLLQPPGPLGPGHCLPSSAHLQPPPRPAAHTVSRSSPTSASWAKGIFRSIYKWAPLGAVSPSAGIFPWDENEGWAALALRTAPSYPLAPDPRGFELGTLPPSVLGRHRVFESLEK